MKDKFNQTRKFFKFSGVDKAKTFSTIKQEYKDYDKSLLENFRLIVRDTEKGIWGPADLDTCFKFFKKIKLQNFKNFLDLGSGDGRIVLLASLFTNATGIEFDSDLHDIGIKINQKLHLNANLIKGDFLKHNLSNYDIIFINPDNGFHKGLEDKLIKEMNKKTHLYIYNNIFLPRFLEKGKTYHTGSAPIIVYRNSKEH
ncbi:MAG: class I SAM-dependent methyltransferase [Nanoarchaeota archaeon]|nr:class I SAM-dependent methyltransferase [Nanoarchaeota archaeon]